MKELTQKEYAAFINVAQDADYQSFVRDFHVSQRTPHDETQARNLWPQVFEEQYDQSTKQMIAACIQFVREEHALRYRQEYISKEKENKPEAKDLINAIHTALDILDTAIFFKVPPTEQLPFYFQKDKINDIIASE